MTIGNAPPGPVGILSGDARVVAEFVHLANGSGQRTYTFPQHAPCVAVTITGGSAHEIDCHPDGSFVVLDGTVYNAGDLRATAGTGDSSTALALLHLYRRQGAAFMGTVNGDVAVTVWDAPREQLALFRSRTGIPPVFYSQQTDRFLWASSIKALLGTGLMRTLDLHALDFFLACGYVPAPWTLLREVRKVPPAHCATIGTTGFGVERYWYPAWHPKHRLGPDEVTRHLDPLFQQAVRRRLPTNGPVGALLSGGVDSALVVADLVRASSAPVHTFTFRYADYDGPYNELEPARAVANHVGTIHHEIPYGPADVAENLTRLIWAYEEPFTYGLHSALLGAVAKEGVQVLLTGSGADGLTGTSPVLHRAAEYARWPRVLLVTSRAVIRPIAAIAPRSRKANYMLSLAVAPFESVYYTPQTTANEIRRRLYRHPAHLGVAVRAALDLFRTSLATTKPQQYRDKKIILDLTFLDPEHMLWWHHRWASLHRLSVRHPFLDNDVCDFLLRCERRYEDKDDIRRLAERVMPAAMAYRPKLHQTIPLAHWFRGPLQGFLRSHLSLDRIDRAGLFNPAVVGDLIDRHVSGARDHTWTLWGLVAFTAWQDLFLHATPLRAEAGPLSGDRTATYEVG